MQLQFAIGILAVVVSSITSSANALPVQSSSVNASPNIRARAVTAGTTPRVHGSSSTGSNRGKGRHSSGFPSSSPSSSSRSRSRPRPGARTGSTQSHAFCTAKSRHGKRDLKNCRPLSDKEYWSSLTGGAIELDGGIVNIGKFLGAGASGAAYAFDGKYKEHNTAAFKCVDDEASLKKETKHLSIIKELYGQGVATIHTGEEDTQTEAHCFAMKLQEGITLKEYFKQPAIQAECQANLDKIMPKVVDKLIFYGKKGVLHGEPTEENVLVTKDGEVNIVDWLLAQVVKPAEQEGALDPKSLKAEVKMYLDHLC